MNVSPRVDICREFIDPVFKDLPVGRNLSGAASMTAFLLAHQCFEGRLNPFGESFIDNAREFFGSLDWDVHGMRANLVFDTDDELTSLVVKSCQNAYVYRQGAAA